jgi:hypothetical protein
VLRGKQGTHAIRERDELIVALHEVLKNTCIFLAQTINSCQIYIDRISGPQVVKTQGQQLLAKEEEILCVLACSLEQVQHVDASVYLRTTDSYSRTGRTSSRLLPMHRLLTLDCTDGRELTGTLDDYRDEEQVNCSPIYLTLVLQLIK